MVRSIIHLDMDAFFASIEQLDHPSYRDKPVIVGGLPNERGVVSTCSYEARKFGVHSAMSLTEAYRRCPQGIFVRGRMTRYTEISDLVFSIASDYTPQIEIVSVDECFMDVGNSKGLFGSGEQIATIIQQRVKNELGLSCSLGVSHNKFLSKLGSDLRKPGGLVVISEQDVFTILSPLPVEKIWGVGPKTATLLRKLGLDKIGDLHNADPNMLERALGKHGRKLWLLAQGLDDRIVHQSLGVKSVGHEHTYDIDVGDIEVVKGSLLYLSAKVGRRLRKKNLCGKTVTLKLRYLDFSTFTRQCTLPEATDLDHTIFYAAISLLDSLFNGNPVRLVGVSVNQLAPTEECAKQLSLFDVSSNKARALSRTMDKIKEKHGEKSITYARKN
ncbi:MAG: DNA polymerase IV [bacterium]|nr:DNA polymerase IV [bacterium]